jgi:hypothetical protein
MLPDRADTIAIIEEQVAKAAEYWGTEFDVEHNAYNELILADVKITRQQFAELVEAKIAIQWADQHADLSRYGLEDECDWFTRAEFIREQRAEWVEPILATVARRTREAREFENADRLNEQLAA